MLFSLSPEKIIKAKWKGLRDNFRIQWKMIPRDEHDQLLINPEEFTGTKWQYYRPLLFLADNMGKSRNSYNHYDDNSYELLQQFEPAIEIPSDDEIELKNHDLETNSGLSPKLHQRLMNQVKVKNEASPTEHTSSPSPPPSSKTNGSSRLPPKLRAIPQMNLMEVQALLARSTVGQVGQTTISPAPMPTNHHSNPNHHHSQNPSSSTQQLSKRRKTDDGVTTTGTTSSNDEFPTASSPAPNNDDDYHFLMSLQPYLNQFNGPQKLKIRMRIQKLIFKELYQEDFDD